MKELVLLFVGRIGKRNGLHLWKRLLRSVSFLQIVFLDNSSGTKAGPFVGNKLPAGL